MNTTVLYAHPWDGSYSRQILDKVLQKLEANGETVSLIDLYADGFDPVMSEKDLSTYGKGESSDPLVKKYISILDKTEKVILLFPIWWYDMPAILRGFFDKAMLTGSAFVEDDNGYLSPVRNIGKTIILTTSAASTRELVEDFGDPINGTIIAASFKYIGFNNAVWHNLGDVYRISEEERKAYLEAIPDKV